MSRPSSKWLSIRSSPDWCYLCGLPIPSEVVSHSHPLFGTVDHVIPLALGGQDITSNRAPAHKICNGKKGTKLISDAFFAVRLQATVLPLLEKLGHNPSKEIIRRSRNRAFLGRGLHLSRDPVRFEVHRWEDDGGSLGWADFRQRRTLHVATDKG